MKIKQIVGEHKKGVKAKIYNKKGPEPRKVPKRPPQQTPAGVATAFAEGATLGDYIPGKTATIKDPDHGKEYTLDLTKPENMAALHPNDQGEIEFNPDFDAAGGGLGSQAQGQEQTPLQPGAPITIKTASEEMGGDPGDEFIDDVVDKDFERAQGRLRELAGVQQSTPSANISLDSAEGFKNALKAQVDPSLAGEVDKLVAVEPDGSVDADQTFLNMMKMLDDFVMQLPKLARDMIAKFKESAQDPEFQKLSPQEQQSALQSIKDMEAQLPAIDKAAQDYQTQMQAQQSQEVSRMQELAGITNEEIIDLGHGAQKRTNPDGTYEIGDESGIKLYSADNKLLKTISPTFNGFHQETDNVTGNVTKSYDSGPLSAKQTFDKTGKSIRTQANYDIGTGVLGYDADHVSGITSGTATPRGEFATQADADAAANAMVPTKDIAAAKGVDPKKFAKFQQQNPSAVRESPELEAMLRIAGLR